MFCRFAIWHRLCSTAAGLIAPLAMTLIMTLTGTMGAVSPVMAAETGKTQTGDNKTTQGESSEVSLARGDATPTLFRNLSYRPSTDISGVDSPPPAVATLCDLTIPIGLAPENGFPCVVVVHGGGWVSGDKWTMTRFSGPLVEAGIATLTINYRLAPSHPFPAQIDDLRTALLWLVDRAPEYSIDTMRIGLAGYSAGAQIALVVGTLADEPLAVQAAASEWSRDDSRLPKLPSIAAVFGGGSPCEFRMLPPQNFSLAYWLGGSRAEKPAAYISASPTAHASAGDPPIMLVHGTGDIIVPFASAEAMRDASLSAGGRIQLLPIEGLGHMLTFLSPGTTESMVRFFREQL